TPSAGSRQPPLPDASTEAENRLHTRGAIHRGASLRDRVLPDSVEPVERAHHRELARSIAERPCAIGFCRTRSSPSSEPITAGSRDPSRSVLTRSGFAGLV